jgi:hypothetical protein
VSEAIFPSALPTEILIKPEITPSQAKDGSPRRSMSVPANTCCKDASCSTRARCSGVSKGIQAADIVSEELSIRIYPSFGSIVAKTTFG